MVTTLLTLQVVNTVTSNRGYFIKLSYSFFVFINLFKMNYPSSISLLMIYLLKIYKTFKNKIKKPPKDLNSLFHDFITDEYTVKDRLLRHFTTLAL